MKEFALYLAMLLCSLVLYIIIIYFENKIENNIEFLEKPVD